MRRNLLTKRTGACIQRFPLRSAICTLSLLLLVAVGPGFLGCSRKLRTAKPMVRSRFYTTQPADNPLRGDVVPVHDPSLVRRPDGVFMVLDTDVDFIPHPHILAQRCSRDLVTWQLCGYVFDKLPPWVEAHYPGGHGLWAPEIAYFGGLYHLYYAASSLGSQHSAIAHATNPTLDPGDPRNHWTDHGVILASEHGQDFNAIDPAVVLEPQGAGKPPRVWLVYGSFWKGIFQRELDPSSGELIGWGRRYHLAQQPTARRGALEAGAMIRHNGWYYLFASTGLCCELPIERDTYQEIVGRSRSVHGPFVAEDGTPLLEGGGTVLLTADANWLAPGGASLWQSEDEQQTLITFHALHRRENGALDLFVERVEWQDAWPVLRPIL